MKLLRLQRIFLGLIVAASLYASIRNLAATPELGSVTEDPVAAWEQRFAAVKEQLPFVRGAVGYISDADVPGADFDPANDEGEYILTQYALAPIVIVRGTRLDWNIANFGPATFALWSSQGIGEFEVQPMRGGLYLLRRVTD